MKKFGIVNPALMGALTALGHYDQFAITDVGMPIPKGICVIDLSIIPGVPGFMQVLKIILREVTVEEYTIFDTMKQYNCDTYNELKQLLFKQNRIECSMEAWIEKSKDVKFFVRTGELGACSNIILQSAPVHEMFREKYDIIINELNS